MCAYKKKMHAIEVSSEADAGMVVITDTEDVGNGESSVFIHIDQLDMVIQWLKEAREDIINSEIG